MITFSKLNKLKTIMSGLIFTKYLFWYTFFILQGHVISLAVEKNHIFKNLIYALCLYIVIKMLVMLVDILQKFLSEHYQNIALKNLWHDYLPKNIYADNQHHKNNINVLFFDYFPKLFELNIIVATNKIIICYVLIITTLIFLYTSFFIGLIALFMVFVLNYLSKNIFIQKIATYQKETHQHKLKILNWIDQYFSSYREISKNWHNISNSSWQNDIYKGYFSSKNSQIFFYFYRDLLAQILVELPFLVNTSIVIIGVYNGVLSITQMFVWIGLSQFMINASNAYIENKVNKQQIATLLKQTQSILDSIEINIPQKIVKNHNYHNVVAKIIMCDGWENTLALKPGLYHIQGGNAAGKSTLINMLLGYERKPYYFENSNFVQLTNTINQNNVRVIERDAVLFECFNDFNSQICGPLQAYEFRWQTVVTKTLNELLPNDLAWAWLNIFLHLEKEYIYRENKIMSSGERIILSLMRFFCSWNSAVNLLIIDECDSFLDHEKRKLFMQTITELSSKIAVYISVHSLSISLNLKKQLKPTAKAHQLR